MKKIFNILYQIKLRFAKLRVFARFQVSYTSAVDNNALLVGMATLMGELQRSDEDRMNANRLYLSYLNLQDAQQFDDALAVIGRLGSRLDSWVDEHMEAHAFGVIGEQDIAESMELATSV